MWELSVLLFTFAMNLKLLFKNLLKIYSVGWVTDYFFFSSLMRSCKTEYVKIHHMKIVW